MKRFLFFLICIQPLFQYACNSDNNKDCTLINNFKISSNEKSDLASFFGDKSSKTTLEENEEFPVGKIEKAIKRFDHYYLLTRENIIFEYNLEGKFLSVLNKKGGGPDEYNAVLDFDVYKIDDKLEIWVSDYKSIKKYRYNGEWTMVDKINVSFLVHKFIRIDDDCLLVMAGQNDKTLNLVNNKGEIFNSFLEKEIPFLTFKPLQFVTYNNQIVFQLGMSNDVVRFDKEARQFSYCKLTNHDQFLTKDQLKNLYKEKGDDYFLSFKDKSYIKTVRKFRDALIMDYSIQSKRYIALFQSNKEQIHIPYFSSDSEMDQLDDNTLALLSMFLADSDNSLMLIKEPVETTDHVEIINYY